MESIILIGDVFIVPNMLMAWGMSGLHHDSEKNNMLTDAVKAMDIDLKPETAFVQVWCTNADSENWSDHGIAGERPGYMPMWLPAAAVHQAGEGGKLVVPWDKYKLQLTVNTQAYRYRNHGRCRDLLSKLKKAGLNYSLTPENETWIADKYPQHMGATYPPCKEVW